MLELQNNMLHSNTVWRAENQRREAQSRTVKRNWKPRFLRRDRKAAAPTATQELTALRPSIAAE